MKKDRLSWQTARIGFLVLALFVLISALSPASLVVAQGPQPTMSLGTGTVVPSPLNADLRTLPYVPPSPGFRPQPSLSRQPQQAKPGGTVQTQVPMAPTANMPAPILTFNAMDYNTNGAGHPPDPNGDIGPNLYMEAVNTSIGIYDKKTGAALTTFTFNSFWSGAGTGTACDTSNQGDPIVLFDSLQNRFIFMDFAWTDIQNGPYYFCFGVSKTSDPVSGGYWRYAVRADDATHPWLPDYMKGAIWPDGIYFGANMFDCLDLTCSSATYKEARAYAINRLKMEAGATLTANDVQFADTNSANDFTMLPSNVRGKLPPAGTPNFFVQESGTAFRWEVFKFHVDYVTPASSTFTGPTNVSQASYTTAATTVSEPAPGNLTDTLADRAMFLNQYRNIGGTESLWVQHTTGTASASTPTGIQWAQINVTGGTVNTTPVQEQIFDNGADGLNRFMGSMAADGSGNVALGYTASSSSVAPDIRYVGRISTDTLNQLPQGETTMLPSVTRSVQTGNCGPSACTRWGDYSAMTVDPVDDCTFWYSNMYFPVQGTNWVTRIGSFTFAQPSQCNPISNQAGAKTPHTPTFDGSAQLGNDFNYATEWLGSKGGMDYFATWDATNLYVGILGGTLAATTGGACPANGCTYVAVVDTDPVTQSSSNTGSTSAFKCTAFDTNAKGNFALSRASGATTKQQASGGIWAAWAPTNSNALDNSWDNAEFKFQFSELTGYTSGNPLGLYLYVCDGANLVSAWPPENPQSGATPTLNATTGFAKNDSGRMPRTFARHWGKQTSSASATGLDSFFNGYLTLNVTAAGGGSCSVDVVLDGNADTLDANMIRRTYAITPNNCTGLVGDLTLKYEDGTLVYGSTMNNAPSEIGAFNESTLALIRKVGASWVDQSATSRNTTANTVTKTGVSAFSTWSLGAPGPTAVTVVSFEAAHPLDGMLVGLGVGVLGALGAVVFVVRKKNERRHQVAD